MINLDMKQMEGMHPELHAIPYIVCYFLPGPSIEVIVPFEMPPRSSWHGVKLETLCHTSTSQIQTTQVFRTQSLRTIRALETGTRAPSSEHIITVAMVKRLIKSPPDTITVPMPALNSCLVLWHAHINIYIFYFFILPFLIFVIM